MSENVIDRTVFNELKDSVGGDFIVELVGTFGEEAPIMIANLRQALSEQDADAFRRETHSMKTNAITFGATDLAELAKSLEYLARVGMLDQVADQVDLLENMYKAAQSELETLSNAE
jgi:HPt (histidine-containing phosphotransfer) domain-containing protein